MQIISVAIGALIFASTLWGSIKIFDRYNSRNSFPLAVFIGLVFALVAPAFGLFLVVLPLVALGYLLVAFYDLGLLKSAGVIVAMMGMNVALAEAMARLAA